MSTPTQYLPAQLVVDLHSTLARLRIARTVSDTAEEQVAEHKLNLLIEKLPRVGGYGVR
jgi:hypothetical protein